MPTAAVAYPSHETRTSEPSGIGQPSSLSQPMLTDSSGLRVAAKYFLISPEGALISTVTSRRKSSPEVLVTVSTRP